MGLLVGRIDSGEPFVVGSSETLVAPENGELYLGINDGKDCLDDNFGVLAVKVSVK
jgi:hypothetical protein